MKATLDVEEVAQALDISVSVAYRELAKGTIPCHRLGGRYVIPRAMFERWLAGEPVQASTGPAQRSAA